MTRDEMRSYVESRPYDTKPRAIWEYVEGCEAALEKIGNLAPGHGEVCELLGRIAYRALAALDERQP